MRPLPWNSESRFGFMTWPIFDSRTRTTRGLVAAIIIAAMFGCLCFSFYANGDCLEIGIDGKLWSDYLKQQSQDRNAFTQFGVDPLRGGFDAYYPLVREYLFPNAIAMPFIGGVPSRSFVYVAYAPILITAFYVLGRVLAVEWSISVLAGFLFSVLGLPGVVHHYGQLLGNLHINPHWSQNIALSLLTIASFWALGDGWRRSSGPILFVPMLCLVIAALSTGLQILFMVPTMAVYGAGSLLESRRLGEIWPRIVAALIALVGMGVLGIVTYLYTFSQYSPLFFFPTEVKSHPVAWHLFSSFFWIEPFGRWAIILGIAGAIWTVAMGAGRLRLFAGIHIAVKLVYFLLAYWLMFVAIEYKGSAPSYFEMFILPFDLLFAALLITASLRLAMRGIERAANVTGTYMSQQAGPVVLTGIIAAFAVYNASETIRNRQALCPARGFRPSLATAITDALQREIALEPGQRFRGLVATITGVDGRGSVSWDDLHGHDYWMWRTVGNDHRSVGLWQFGIPTLFQLIGFVAPPYFLLTTEFLARPADVQTRSELALTLVNEPIMKLWGVRYLITDRDDAPGSAVLSMPIEYTQPVPKKEILYLREFSGVNLANYSPVKVIRAADFRSGLAAMHDTGFDGRQTVVTNGALNGEFVPARGVTLTYQKYGFDLNAESPAESILVLPVLYSHCWSIDDSKAMLFRANLMQMGVKFSGTLKARLFFRYGPLFASGCRLEDIDELKRLKIQDARSSRGIALKN